MLNFIFKVLRQQTKFSTILGSALILRQVLLFGTAPLARTALKSQPFQVGPEAQSRRAAGFASNEVFLLFALKSALPN